MRNARFGLLVVLVLAAVTYLGFTKDVPLLNQPFEIEAAFRDSAGIRPGSPVRIAGVEVGKVTKVAATSPGGRSATVTMAIRDVGKPVHRDASAKIRPRIFLEGNFFVDLSPGTPQAREIRAGETIPVERTAYPVQFDQVLKALKTDTREDLRDTFAELFRTQSAGGGRAFNRSLEYQADAFRYSAVVSEALLGERPDDLADFIRDSGKVGEALDAQPARLRSLITNFNRTTRALAERESDLRATVRELPVTLREAVPAFRSLDAAFPSVRAFARAARPGVRSTGPAVDALLPLVRQLRGLVGPDELRGLAADLRTATPPLTRLARQSVPLLQQQRLLASCTTNVLVPAGDQTVPDPDFPATGSAHQEFAKVLANLAGESRSFDANGQWFKVQGSGGVETVDLGDNVFGTALRPIVGINPPPDRTRPPLRPDVPCETQEPPDYNTEPGRPPQRAQGTEMSNPLVSARYAKAREVAVAVKRAQLRAQGRDTEVLDRDATPDEVRRAIDLGGLSARPPQAPGGGTR